MNWFRKPRYLSCLLALVAGAAAAPIQAQGRPIQRGSVQLAGTAQFTHTRDIGNDRGWTTFELIPRVGYFIVPGLAVSANLRFQRNSASDQHFTEWGVGPGLTYYVNLKSRHFYPFVSGRTLLTWNKTHDQVLGTYDSDGTNRVWLVSGGGLFMLGQHVGITGELFYQHERFSVQINSAAKQSNSSETYGLQWGVAAFLF